MKHYVAFSKDAETVGQVHLSLLQAINLDHYQPFLKKYNLDDINPERWYPMQIVLDLLGEIAGSRGGMLDLVSIGMKIMENAILPPEVEALPFEQVVAMWDQFYLANNRGTDPGYIKPVQVTPKHYQMIHHIPYPDDYAYGGIYGGARRWLPVGTNFTVYYDEELPRRDKDDAETTVIHVQWD